MARIEADPFPGRGCKLRAKGSIRGITGFHEVSPRKAGHSALALEGSLITVVDYHRMLFFRGGGTKPTSIRLNWRRAESTRKNIKRENDGGFLC
jgi:hypothetical protein